MGWDTHTYKPVVLVTAFLYLLRRSQVRQRKFPCNQNVSITTRIPFFRVVDAVGGTPGGHIYTPVNGQALENISGVHQSLEENFS